MSQYNEGVGTLHEHGDWGDRDSALDCANEKYRCDSVFSVAGSDGPPVELSFAGSGDASIVGHELGPRALVWQRTELRGNDPALGEVLLRLDRDKASAGTIVPTTDDAFPAVHRSSFNFALEVNGIGELVSDRPAIVQGSINSIPDATTYTMLNGPIDFYRRGDESKTTVATLHSGTIAATCPQLFARP